MTLGGSSHLLVTKTFLSDELFKKKLISDLCHHIKCDIKLRI